MLTAFYGELQQVTSSFCSNEVSSYWKKRFISAETLNHFGVAAYNPGSRSLTSILEGKGYSSDQIRGALYSNDDKRELFQLGSIIPISHESKIWNLMFISAKNVKLYCKGIKLHHPFNIDDVIHSDLPVVVCEAPIDAMSAWQLGVKNVISAFGVNFQNLDFSLLTSRKLITLFDNDEAGRKGAEMFQKKYSNTKICFIPNQHGKDVNDFLVSGGTPELLQEIIQGAVVPCADDKKQFFTIPTSITESITNNGNSTVAVVLAGKKYNFFRDRRALFFAIDENGKEKKLHPTIYEIIQCFYQYFIDTGGKFIFDKSRNFGTLFLDEGSIILELGNIESRNWLFEQLQIFSIASMKGREFVAALNDFLFDSERSTIVTSVCFATADQEHHAAYFYTGDDSIIRICAGEIKPLRNGLNEYSIGLVGPTFPFQGWKYDPTISKADAVQILYDFYVKSLALDEADALVSLAFNLTHMSPDLNIRVCKENNGSPGSGKSDETKLWGAIVFGKPILGCFRTEDEVWVAVNRNPFVALDNLEDNDVSKYFMILTSGITGGSAQKRKLYSDEQLLTYSMHGQVTVTCIRGNSWQEVIQRTISFTFDQQYHRSDYNYQIVLSTLQEKRPVILSGIFKIMADDIFPFKEDFNCFADQFLKQLDHPRRRLNLFLREMLLWLSAISKYLNKDWEAIARTFFARSIEQYNSDVVDSDLVMQCLNDLKENTKDIFSNHLRLKTKITTSNFVLSIEGYAADFFQDFLKVNKSRTERFFKTPKSLGQRLKSIENKVINTIGWTITRDSGNLSKGIYYRFKYDLQNDASSGMQTNVTHVMEKIKNDLRKNDQKIIRLDKPIRTPSEILSIISSGNISAIEAPSLRFLGASVQDTTDVCDILEQHKITIIINGSTGWMEI